MTDFFDGIEDAMTSKAEADAEAADIPKFDPKAGEMLNAVLLEAKPFTGGDYDPTIILTFRNVGDKAVGGIEPGASGVLFTPTVLRRKLLEAQPAIGTPFALRFEGTVTPPKGFSYKDWTLLTAYMKSGSPDDVNPQMWHAIAAEVSVSKAPTTQATPSNAPDMGDWKF